MRKIIIIHRHRDQFGDNAERLMRSEEYRNHIQTYGYHFSNELAEKASCNMKNTDGTTHTWTVEDVKRAVKELPQGSNWGDITYLANMAYADFFPGVIKTETLCLEYALSVAEDPDGYEGMAFMRYVADRIGKGESTLQ